MKKYYRKASMFFSACISCSLAFASVGDDYLKGWNDTQKGTPAQVGWGSQQDIEWGTNGDKDASWRINVGSPVNNGDDAMLYTTVPDNKLYYAIHDLPTGMLYQLSGKTWRRNGGTGSLDSHFTITSNINNGSILLDYTSTVSGNNVTKEFQSERFIIPKNTESTLYLTWDCTLNGGSWQNAGIWGLQLVELGEALTVTFDTGGGSTVSPQYLLKDGKEQAKEPLAPTKTGYTFLGWYTSLSSDTPYDFSSVVTHDITIYAKWEDGKEKLKTQIANAEKIIKEGTEKGKKYLNAAITEAKTVAQNSQATSEEIENAIKSLSTAVSQYQDSTLSSLTVDGKTITGFLPTVYEYTYSLSVSETNIPQTAVTTNATCAAYEIQNTTTIPGITTVTVTAGNGSTATYSIKFVHNYLDGWDANGFTDRSPYDAGWRCSDENFEWSTDVADQNTKGTYRDDLNVGRVFIHPKNNSVFSFPIKGLEVGKEYTFTCTSSKMSGNQGRPTTFTVNTESDGTGTVIGSVTADAGKWPGSTNYSFSFVVPENGDYFLTWKTEDSDGDRSLAWGFTLTQTGEALKITFDSDGGTAIAPQYLSEGDVIQEPEDPVKYGFIFNGWWYNDDGFDSKWNFELGVEKDMTLVAHWIDPTSVGSHSKDPSFKVEGMSGGVKLTTTQAIHVKVYNISGQRILSTSIAPGETTINLPSGIYIVNRVKVIVQ